MTTVYPIAATTAGGYANTLYIVVCPGCGQEHKHSPTTGKKKAPCGAIYTLETNGQVPPRKAPPWVDPVQQARYDEAMAATFARQERDRWQFWLETQP